MSDRAAFIRAICEQPTDDTVRLVFADWLEEHDEPARAEFIRVQVKLAKKPVGCHRHAKECPRYGLWRTRFPGTFSACVTCAKCWPKFLYHRQEQLWNFGAPGHWSVDDPLPFAHCIRCIDEESISGSLAVYDPIAIYRRGFIDQITCSAADWLTHCDLLYWHPSQTAECPTCEGEGWVIDRDGHVTNWTRERCPHCNAGRLPRPCPETAHPLTSVVLTGLAEWDTMTEWFSETERCQVMRDGTMRDDRWPGIEFTLPRLQPV
jgi:uncharacterized protein (TIGR02996 family)